MSLHELHPEELLDKAERGSLDAGERKQLDRHLTSCAVCRFEVNARDDFRARGRTEDALFSDDAIDMIVGASLRGADARRAKLVQDSQPELQGNLRVDLQTGSSRPRALQAGRRWAVLLAVAVLLISAQATARWLGIRPPSWLTPPSMTTVTTNGAPADDTVKAAPVAQMKPLAPASIPSAAPIAVATDLTDPVAPPNANLTPSRSLTSTPSTTTTSIARPVTTTRPEPSASALFETANTDREQGKHVVATREYRELLENYPNAPEADLSRATLGRLLLDDGDAMTALPLFDAYLQRADSRTGAQGVSGALREETMVNRATALERLHRSGEEADAWRAFLDAYPQSLHAERARERLKELATH
jgi:hypothetical protein